MANGLIVISGPHDKQLREFAVFLQMARAASGNLWRSYPVCPNMAWATHQTSFVHTCANPIHYVVVLV
eukprot:6477688-Amphidinium_carterae.1